MPSALDLAYHFTGRWLTQNSPANRVPSHGTTRYAASHAIDFVPVDTAGRTGPITLRDGRLPRNREIVDVPEGSGVAGSS